MIVGRQEELQLLRQLCESGKSEFVAVYGRRRIGKTFLVREAFNYKFSFEHTGMLDAPLKEQLKEFRESLYNAGMGKTAMPKSWSEAFHLLERHLASQPEGRKVLFIDELPWMDTPKSNFIRALDHFWNSWASARRDIVLVVCGSATSWIISNIIMNYGGLHNRLTRQIHLKPFRLKECEEYCKRVGLGFTRRQVLEAYMAMGGVPFYWSYLIKGQSLAQNFDRMFFSSKGELIMEYDALYNSLFRRPQTHIKLINALASKKIGLTREELLREAKLDDNETFAKALTELEQCDFIRKYTCIGKKNKSALYQLMDNFTLFYFKFMRENVHQDTAFWTSSYNSQVHDVWAGLAFEQVCLQHIDQIKAALGITGVATTAYSWTHKTLKPDDQGVQIDLLIDRKDDVINLCEIKYCGAEYHLTEDEESKLRRRKDIFVRETKTNKAVMTTMITTYGLQKGGYADEIQAEVKMEDLFA